MVKYFIFCLCLKNVLVYTSLYTLTAWDLIEKCKEPHNTGISINATDLYHPDNIQEVLLHPVDDLPHIMAISPNNAAFIVSVVNPVVSFYTATIIQYSTYSRILIAL
jgi:hypothetical protein